MLRFVFPVSLACMALVCACKPSSRGQKQKNISLPPPVVDMSLLDKAREKHAAKKHAEALELCFEVLKSAPASAEALDFFQILLKEIAWTLPELHIRHTASIDQVHFAEPASLWVSLAGKMNTTVRWNLENIRLEAVLFPQPAGETRSLQFDPEHRFVVIDRGEKLLLADAQTLKPIRDLGAIPKSLLPAETVTFSANGLLVAHPVNFGQQVSWHIRDSSTGEVIRSSSPLRDEEPRALAAFLNPSELRVIRVDGSLLEVPISPIKPLRETSLPEPLSLERAQFSLDGNSVLTLQSEEDRPAVSSIISYSDQDDGSLELASLAQRFPWSRQENIWNRLIKDELNLPFRVDGKLLDMPMNQQLRFTMESEISAVTFVNRRVIIGEKNGSVSVHRLLPPASVVAHDTVPKPIDSKTLAHLAALVKAITGEKISPKERASAFRSCDFGLIREIFPHLDFSAAVAEFQTLKIRQLEEAALSPLDARIARALPVSLTDEVETAWREGRFNEVLHSIKEAGGKGALAANALARALKEEKPEPIEQILSIATSLPPLLKHIGQSRITWLRGNKADVVSRWPDVFPTIQETRLIEDWDGWEQADFQPALDQIRDFVSQELAAIKIPENATPQQRQDVGKKLLDLSTINQVGRERYAEACLKTAMAFCRNKDEARMGFQLASIARDLGVVSPECLRTEATALSTDGDFVEAHPLWIQLITEYQPESQQPNDYTEAAHSAFENMNPAQAMEILDAGIRNFPEDVMLATQAGRIALVAGDAVRAYRFLSNGKRIGFLPDKIDESIAYLAIAAVRMELMAEATSHFQDIAILEPKWTDPKTLDQLDWPEEMKENLRSLMKKK